jgi:geranylgeranyl diphosphate synthase type II
MSFIDDASDLAASRMLVASTLEEYGALVRKALQKYLPAREPRKYLYDLAADYPNRGGKMMRPSICIATARAFGGRLEDALASAVAFELLHNAILIHDDVQDESDERRCRPTMHVLHGVPLAINVGDSLMLLSLKPLLENHSTLGADLSVRILEELQQVASDSAEGQAMELGWRHDNAVDVTPADYLDMVLKKTCGMAAIYPTRVGALIGTRGRIDLNRFVRFGFFLGAAFQIQDDILNLFADDRYGKERNGDIWEGKRTLMMIHLLQNCTLCERERITDILHRSRKVRCETEVRWIRRLMDTYGCIDYAQRMAHGLAGAAVVECAAVFEGVPDSRDRRFIEGLPRWVFERN